MRAADPVVENFIGQDVDEIVLALLDDRALVPPIKEAQRAGISTVIIDSALVSDAIVIFAAMDDFKGGAPGCRATCKVRGKSCSYIIRKDQLARMSARRGLLSD